MSRLRAFLVALMILAVALSPVIVPSAGLEAFTGGSRAFAATASAPASDNHDDDDDDDDNDDGDDDDDNDDGDDDDDDNDDADNDDGDNDDADDDNDDADDDNDNGGDDDDDADDDNANDNEAVAPPAPVEPALPPAPLCSTPGQEMAFQSDDGRVTVRVFGTMTQSVRFSIRAPIDPASVPPAPGPIVGGLLFQLIAETCDGVPLASLPAEINLGLSYSDADAAGMNEDTYTIGRLDTTANRWGPTEKQATDPPANFTSATITEMGYYVLYQRS